MKDKNRNNLRNKELASSSVKKAVDGVYDLIMVNALFILFNLHVLLFLLLLRPASIATLFLFMGLSSLNLLPSYAALVHAVRKKEGSVSVFASFVKGYRKNFKNSFLIGLLGGVLILFTLYNGLFFQVTGMDVAYVASQLLVFILLFAVLATVPVMVREKAPLKEVSRKIRKDFFRLLPGAAAAVLIILMSVYLGRFIIVTLIFGFALAAMAQDVLYEKYFGQTEKKK